MGLFDGRQRKQWRSAVETARRAEAVGNVAQMQTSIRAALAMRSAVPEAWLDELRDTLATYESTSYGARALTFAALRAECSLDLELAMRWRAALSQLEAEVRRIEGNPNDFDLDPVLEAMESLLSLDPLIPWEMKDVDVPPMWEGFLRAARLTAGRGYAVTSLRVLQDALPLAESLPAQCSRQLAEVAATLEAESTYAANREAFGQLSMAAREVARRTVDLPPMSRPPPSRPQPNPTPSRPVSSAAGDSFSVVRVEQALTKRRFGEAGRLVLAAKFEELQRSGLPSQVRDLPGLAPWASVADDLGLSEPPRRWDRSRAGKVRIRWASRLRWPQLTCVVITADGRWSLIVQDRSREPEPNLAEVPIELSGSVEECVDWGKRILKDRRLYVALVDVAAAWSPTSTPERISKFLGGVALPALPVADALPTDSGPLPLPVRPGGYLGFANRLEELVLSGAPLDDPARAVLGEFILKTPLSAGTWGPFKGIFKALEPRADEFPDALGTVLARITCLSGADPLPTDEALSVITGGDIAGRKTLAYLDRRGRRVLRTLSWRDHDAYVAVVTAFLGCVDSLLADGKQIERRDALDFTLYGAVRSVAPHMRFPSPPSMPQRHLQRWDPTPEAWNQHSAQVSALLAHTATSPDIATWAFQVLSDLGAEIPVIHAEPALLSGNTELQEVGVAAVAGDPAAINLLSPEALATVLARMPVEDAASLASRLPTARVESVLESLLVTQDRVPHLTFTAVEERRVAMLAIDLAGLPDPVQLPPAVRIATLKTAILWGLSGDLAAVADGLTLGQLAELRQELGTLPDADTAAWLDDRIIHAAREPSWQTSYLAAQWVELSDPELARLGWRLADAFFGDDSGFLAFVQGRADSLIAVAACVTGLASAGTGSRVQAVLQWWAQTANQQLWEESVPVIDRALADNPPTWSHLWPLLSEAVEVSVSQRMRQLPSLPQGMVESVAASAIGSFDDRQIDALWSFLTDHPQRFAADDAFALAVTVVPKPVLCSTAIAILRSQDRIKDLWLPLIESGLPSAVAAGEQHLLSLADPATLRVSMLDLLDSGNREARSLAMTLLSDSDVDLEWNDVLDEMTEHRDPRIWREVADRLTEVGDQELLHAFERRVLSTRREGRAAKTLIQDHLSNAGDHEELHAAVDILMAMAHGDTPRDREWAVSQLLTLAESGIVIPDLDVIDQAG